MAQAVKKKRGVNMTEGPFLKKIIGFTIPLILTGFLQSFYNAADLAVVGKFAPTEKEGAIALAAVGCTGALTNLVVGLFMGLSVGAGVVVATHLGALRYKRVGRIVHSAILMAAVLGVVVGAAGFFLARPLLILMDTPAEVLDSATLYLKIIFCGVPASMVYNYCAAMIRSDGDTKHPLIFLSISGLVNVLLNLLMVAVFHMGVAGVAIATISSQYLSATMILIHMARSDGYMKFNPKLLRFDWYMIKKMLYIGIPSGIQSSLFSLANVMIQSSVNSFGDMVVAGNTAASNLEGFVYIATNSVYQAALTFVGQNVGAKKYRNVKKVALTSVLCAVALGVAGGMLIVVFRQFFAGLYTDSDEALQIAMGRIVCVMPFYFLCGVMEVLSGCLRGMGKSFTTMIVSLLGACVFRIAWVKILCTFIDPTLTVHVFGWDIPMRLMAVYMSYPISWSLVILFNAIFLVHYYRKLAHPKNRPLDEIVSPT